MAKNHDIVEVEVDVLHETEKAYLVTQGETFSSGEPINEWLPKSQCQWDGETMQLPEWLALEKGLI